MQGDWTTFEIRTGKATFPSLSIQFLMYPIMTGDIVNVIGTFTTDSPSSSSTSPIPTITLTSAATSPLLIHHPDILITATSLSATPTCTRRPLLNSLVRSSTDVSPALVWGNILHEVMQSCLRDNDWDERSMQSKIDKAITRSLDDLLRINVDVDQAKREIWSRAGGLKTFAARYISDMPKACSVPACHRNDH